MHKFICLLLALSLLAPVHGLAAEQISKQQAASIAKSRFKGRVIAVDESSQNNTPVYRVRVLDKKGGMHTIVIDHQTGKILSAH